MNCKEIRTLLDAWHDGELEEEIAGQVRKHIEECTTCQLEHQSLQRMSLALRRDFQANVPKNLVERAFLAAMTSGTDSPSFLKSLFPMAWPTAIVSIVAAVFLVGWSFSRGPSVQITDTELFYMALGTSSTQQVNTIVQEVLGIDTTSSEGAK